MKIKIAGILLSLVLLIGSLSIIGCTPEPEAPEETFKVGLPGALTGVGGPTYLTMDEGLRIYFEKLNDAGGINGHKIELYMEDDRAEPTRAVSNVKKLVEEKGIQLLVVDSHGGVYSGITGEIEKADIPQIRMMVGWTDTTPPELNRLSFCTLANAVYDFPFLLAQGCTDFLMEKDVPLKCGLLSMDHPVARTTAEMNKTNMENLGTEVVLEFVPVAVTDLSSVAQNFYDEEVTYIFYYGAGNLDLILWEEMLKLGWDGWYSAIGATMYPEVLEPRVEGRTEKVFSMNTYVPLLLDLPAHQEIIAAAEKYGVSSLDSGLVEGWCNGMVIEAIFSEVDFPVTTEKLLLVMNDLTVDRSPFYGPLIWTDDNHCGWSYLRIYSWDDDGKFVSLSPWYATNWDASETRMLGDQPELE